MAENMLDRIKRGLDESDLSEYAMVPVVALSSGLLKGGKGRIGKSARNLAKKRNPVVTRYHRTHVGNIPSIEESGLLMSNGNYGRNTADSEKLPPMVWLSGRDDMIPVLRSVPEEQALYRVDIPRNEYYASPRYRFKYGRGYSAEDGNVQLAEPSEQSVSREGEYVIDALGRDVPKEWITRIDNVPERPVSERVDLKMMKPRSMSIISMMPEEKFENLPRRFKNSANVLQEASYDVEDDLGVDVLINDLPEVSDKVELDKYLLETLDRPTLDQMSNYMMEGAWYDENPSETLLDRVKLQGGLVPYPGNGKRYTVLDMAKFRPYEGHVSRGNDLGQGMAREGMFPGNMVERPDYRNVSRPLSREDKEKIKSRLKKNYEYITK